MCRAHPTAELCFASAQSPAPGPPAHFSHQTKPATQIRHALIVTRTRCRLGNAATLGICCFPLTTERASGGQDGSPRPVVKTSRYHSRVDSVGAADNTTKETTFAGLHTRPRFPAIYMRRHARSMLRKHLWADLMERFDEGRK